MPDSLEIYTKEAEGNHKYFSDFKIGKIELAKHLGIENQVGSLDADPSYARQLLLLEPSTLGKGRAPLFVCSYCGDLGCGATTVLVSDLGNTIQWSDFGYENNWEEGISQTDYMKRTGPFVFNKIDYVSTIKPYAKRS
ncbi:hypothetical protein [Aurantivibrio infirmus]